MILKINKDFLILLTGRLLQIVTTLFSLRISSSLMPESELGLVYYIVAVQSFFSLFLINPVGQYFNRHTNRWYKEGIIYSCFKKQCYFIFVVAIAALLILTIFHYLNLIELSFKLILIGCGLIFSQSLNQTVIPALNMLNRRYAFVIFNLLTSILCAIISFSLLVFVKNNAESWLFGIVIGSMIINFFASRWFKIIAKENVKIEDIENDQIDSLNIILLFTLPIAFSTFFMWFLGSGYRILIEQFNGLEFLAVLGIGMAVSSQIFAIAESLLMQYLLPTLYRNIEYSCESKRVELLNAYLSTVVPLYLSLALFLTFSIQHIFPFLVAEKYHSFYIYAIYGAWVELFRSLTNAFSITAQIEKKTGKTVYPYIIGAISLSSMLIIKEFLSVDINVMHLLIISNLVVLICMVINMLSYLPFKLPLKEVFSITLVVIPSLLYFNFINYDSDLSLGSFVYLTVGSGLYFVGLFFCFGRFGRLKND